MDDPYININFIPPYKLQFKDDCTYYGARRYCYEPPTFCCAKGQIVLANQETPVPLRNLFCAADDLSKHFQVCVRTYNNTFAFTSMGIHNYATDLCRRNKGIYTFKVQGQIYHFINDMLPDGCQTISQETMAYHGTRLDKEVIDVILSTLAENPYAKFFHNLRYMNTAEEFSVILKKNPTLDQRVYNMPTASQVAAIWVEDDGNGVSENRHIRVYAKGGQSQTIQYYYGCYDPLQYPLLFPHGETGWHEGIEKRNTGQTLMTNEATAHINITSNTIGSATDLIEAEEEQFTEGLQKKNKVSSREYYAYKLQMRPLNETFLLHTGRLLQQFVVDMYVKLETQRLDYFRQKQTNQRTSTLNDLEQSIEMGIQFGADVGKRIVLPVTFICGPRNMRRRYMDAMALVQRFGKPDLFLTITCDPNWPEIKESLRYADEVQNRPDLIARILNGRIHELKIDLFQRKIYGEVSAYTYVIEFQKRGSLHAHFLIVLKKHNKIISPTQCDKIISSEIPNPGQYPELYLKVRVRYDYLYLTLANIQI
ncbi:hypothetical protein DM860_001101 [Cuscuta australis]|uniref:Helitron helicase-like domain-containing protein n=1 Tax=Cuscuta australis TaxID=267555 RepID=A0A328DX76_9ASTE|nr:hypothetical protein DM860_001101 [Cuscuta australis]